MSLGLAELAGILASIAVAVLFTKRSVRPLAQALALQRRFVADASHELRAPLTVLHTRAQMLARRAADGDADALKKDADALVADTRVLEDIVNDLLASATMMAGTAPRDVVDLSGVAAAVCDSAAAHAASLGVTILFASEKASRVEVIGSESALRRALTSLIDNALAHGHDGGTIDVRVRRRDGRVSATVADDGVGIDPADGRHAVHSLLAWCRPHPDGSPPGLMASGLALVREIAQAHDGDITVTSNPGQGATFTLTLPAAPAG